MDQNLITKTIINLQQSLKTPDPTMLPYVFRLVDLLPAETLDKINNYCIDNDLNATAWKEENTEGTNDTQEEMHGDCTAVEEESAPRRALAWAPDTIVEELQESFQRLTPAIEKMWGKPLVFHSLNLWEDSPGFKMNSHLDNDAVGVSLQVYLNECDENVGTEFYAGENLLYKLPWIKNTGYICNHTPDSWHGILQRNTITRRSAYVIYSNKI